ncbi:MAG: DeoR/GlpR transcriptional regulator [Clostridia bacterium]|nr:DeoR/GlpR transcriptional regulator [Clostridia bacterium]
MNQERRSKILQLINAQGTVSNEELIKTFGISIETVRRDLSFLEKQGLLERVYGGAVKKTFLRVEPSYQNRELKHTEEKIAIAEAAKAFIEPNDTVFFDLGTSVLYLAQRVTSDKNVTAFTNALRTAIALSENGCKVVILGGEIRKGELSLTGTLTKENIQRFNFDKAFIGVAGITKNGLTDFIIDEANIRAEIIKNARKTIVLADHSKFGVRTMCRVCDIKDVDVIITDKHTPENVLKDLEHDNLEIIVAE